MKNEMTLKGKVALVTGSSRGIGRAIALELARSGASVVVTYFRKRKEAEATVKEIRSHGVDAISVRVHIGKSDQIEAMFKKAEESFGGVDILVCNAASGVFKPAMQIDQRSWDWTMDINAKSVLWCAQHTIPNMEARGWGRIVNVSSLGTFRMLPYYSMTGVSKGAIETLTRYLAVELAPKGIIVNAVAPGAISTEEWTSYPGGGETVLSEILQRTPMGRLVTPEDVARVVVFLCTDNAEAIVGQTITIDGGWSLPC